MEESGHGIGSLEQLRLYADEYYVAGKLPLKDHLGKVTRGFEECHQHNAGPLRFQVPQLDGTCYQRLCPPRPFRLLWRERVTWQRGWNYIVSSALHTRMQLSSVSKTIRYSSLNTKLYQFVAFHIALAWHHCRWSRRCFGVKGNTRKGRLEYRFDSARRSLEMICGTTGTLTLYRWMSHCGMHEHLPQDPSILSPCRLPGYSRPGRPHVGTISYPMLPAYSHGTPQKIDLVGNTARRPACEHHADDETHLKLA